MVTVTATQPAGKGRARGLDPRYMAPIAITIILIVAQTGAGILESLTQTGVAIGVAIGTEVVLGRLLLGRVPHLASAYVSGISCGILIRSPFMWPFVWVAALSIVSKYALRYRGRHLNNPSNFGICAMLLVAPQVTAVLAFQWGNDLLPNLVIWCVGAVVAWRARMLHVSIAYVLTFLTLGALRAAWTGGALLTVIAPLSGAMYQLFVLFMITDPRTTLSTPRRRVAVAVLIGVVEAALRLLEVVNAPFFSLFLVGPAALFLELRSTRADASPAPAG